MSSSMLENVPGTSTTGYGCAGLGWHPTFAPGGDIDGLSSAAPMPASRLGATGYDADAAGAKPASAAAASNGAAATRRRSDTTPSLVGARGKLSRARPRVDACAHGLRPRVC